MTIDAVRTLLARYVPYRAARLAFLRELDADASNRDPIAELSERLVAHLLDGKLARSRVQKGYDLVLSDGATVQVKYVANANHVGAWANEHVVQLMAGVSAYALVVYISLVPQYVLVFSAGSLGAIGAALGKRHPDQDVQLQLTRRNAEQIVEQTDRFAALGARVIPLDEIGPIYNPDKFMWKAGDVEIIHANQD